MPAPADLDRDPPRLGAGPAASDRERRAAAAFAAAATDAPSRERLDRIHAAVLARMRARWSPRRRLAVAAAAALLLGNAAVFARMMIARQPPRTLKVPAGAAVEIAEAGWRLALRGPAHAELRTGVGPALLLSEGNATITTGPDPVTIEVQGVRATVAAGSRAEAIAAHASPARITARAGAVAVAARGGGPGWTVAAGRTWIDARLEEAASAAGKGGEGAPGAEAARASQPTLQALPAPAPPPKGGREGASPSSQRAVRPAVRGQPARAAAVVRAPALSLVPAKGRAHEEARGPAPARPSAAAVPPAAFPWPSKAPPPAPAPPEAPPRGWAPSPAAASTRTEAAILAEALGKLRHDRDPAAALALLDRHAPELARGDLAEEATLLRIEAWLARGDHAAVLRALDRLPLATHFPARRDLHLLRAELRARAGRCSEALPDFTRAQHPTARDDTDRRARQGRIDCLRATGDHSRAAAESAADRARQR